MAPARRERGEKPTEGGRVMSAVFEAFSCAREGR